MKQGAGWIIESTKEIALQVANDCLKQNKISSYDKPERFIKGISRNTKQPIYSYKIHCYN